ncbi:Hypothetical predicted protein [Mytilus galloprovincialis]|uniref:Uncharacterized protein n=1 Tax=Mytilus galloprovincialis TaxID=29158 RepID=A0A8B6HG27_MYTGA|nr:Hypothetical predicted protein [Mytilus galloprovincialis]
MQDQLHTVIPHASKLQSFLGIHQIEQQVHQCQRYIDDLEKDDRAKEFTIKMEENNEVEKMIKKFGSLGELTVVKTDMDLKRETSVRREAQVESINQTNINNMTINIEKKIKININKIISDMICLMDGRLIIVEWDLSGPKGLCTDTYGNIIVADEDSHRIIVISKDGKESKVLLSDGLNNPRCICLKQNESSGFICDNIGKNLTKFNLSSG